MLIPLLLAALAAPASAALRPASCLRSSSGAAPASLDELRECQEKTRASVVAAAEKKGAPLTEAQLDKIDDYQRGEARAFLSQSQVVSTGNADDAAPAPAPAPVVRRRRKRKPAPAVAPEPAAAPEPAPAQPAGENASQGASLLDGVPTGGVPAETAEKLRALHINVPTGKPADADPTPPGM